jgi:hypothetical protein
MFYATQIVTNDLSNSEALCNSLQRARYLEWEMFSIVHNPQDGGPAISLRDGKERT